MARQKIEERNTRKLYRIGNGKSYSLTLLVEYIRELGWQKAQRVTVKINKKNKSITIKDWEK